MMGSLSVTVSLRFSPYRRSSRQLAFSAPVGTFAFRKNLGIRRRFCHLHF
jgi:hypothetical protein